MTVYVINFWLLLQHARADERKRAMAQVYISEHLPRVRKRSRRFKPPTQLRCTVRDAILA